MPSARSCWRAARKKVCGALWKSSKKGRGDDEWRGREAAGFCSSFMETRSLTLPWAMKIDVVTLFPAMFVGPLDESIIKRARESGLLDLAIHNLRDYAHDRHKTVDDRPFGGGPGMLLKPEPIFEAVESLANENTQIILLSPGGRTLNQAIVRELAQERELLLISGHYEGFDERIR